MLANAIIVMMLMHMKACAYIHNRQFLVGWRTQPSSSYHHHQMQRKVASSNAFMKYGSRRSTNDIFHIIHTDTSLKRTTSSEEDTATIWHMHRDECDDWLDEVLIDRLNSDKAETSNCKHQQPSSLFKTAALVVGNVMSRGEKGDESSKPLLRRIALEEGIDNNITDGGTNEEMFSALFGTSSTSKYNEDMHNESSSSDNEQPDMIKRTSKKNKKCTNLRITIAYRGLDFCGWEDQRHYLYRNKSEDCDKQNESEIREDVCNDVGQLPSVQGTIADVLDPILRGESNNPQQKRRTNNKPLEVKVAGRTDKGVSAIGQVCRVRTWKEIDDVERYVTDYFNKEVAKSDIGIRIMDVQQVGEDFHPSFGASSRSYVYLIDLDGDDDDKVTKPNWESTLGSLVMKMDRMLRKLEGKDLDYLAMSHGKVKTQTTLCTLSHARAEVVEYVCDDTDEIMQKAICVELVGNRFLRRMVRILVSTALREAYRGTVVGDAHGSDDALLRILSSKDRRLRARASPPDGLIFTRATFGND